MRLCAASSYLLAVALFVLFTKYNRHSRKKKKAVKVLDASLRRHVVAMGRLDKIRLRYEYPLINPPLISLNAYVLRLHCAPLAHLCANCNLYL